MRNLLYLIVSILFVLPAAAQKKVRIAPAPDWIRNVNAGLGQTPPYNTISDGYYYNLLDLQTNLSAAGEFTHYIKHIANESGVQNASEVSVTFAPAYQELIFHKVVILRDGQIINQLQKGVIKVVQEEGEASNFQYNGRNRAYITLKDVRKGDQIEVLYSITGFNPVFGNKFSDHLYFSHGTAVCNFFQTLITRPDRKLVIQTYNDAPKPREELQGNTYRYYWDNPPLKLQESLAGTPSWYDNTPSVSVTEFSGWMEVVNWGLKTFSHYQTDIPENLRQKIRSWRLEAKGDKDRFANLVIRFVQNEVRYLGLEIGPNTHQPHTPAQVFTQRYGDCKDKAFLLAAILQNEKIPAYVALLNTGKRSHLKEALPSPDEFDHAIVALERSAGAFLFIDPTISGQRGELINLFTPDYGYALVLRDGENQLRPVTPGSLHSISIVETLNVQGLNSLRGDSSTLNVTSTFTGGAADNTRNDLAENSAKDLEESSRKFYAGLFDGVQVAAPIESTDDSIKNEVVVKEFYSIPRIWDTAGKTKKFFEYIAKSVSEYLPTPPSAKIEAPLAIRYPRQLQYALEIDMPEAWSFTRPDLHIKNGSYQFDFTPVVKGNHISLHYFFRSFRDHIPEGELAQYKTDYKNMEDRLSFRLSITTDPDARTYSPDHSFSVPDPSPKGQINWKAVWVTFFLAMFFSWLVKQLNARSETVPLTPGIGQPLGGWTLFLGFTLVAGMLARIINFAHEKYYSAGSWETLGKAGGTGLQLLSLAELVVSLLFLAGGGSVLFWFVNKRDIFPRMFTWYAGLLLSGQLLLIILFSVVPYSASLSDLKQTMIVQFTRTCIWSAIWVSYIKRSERVQRTFVQPFRWPGR
ncbi:DUF3857 domain-containing protein [Flavitalea flava]